MKRVLLVTLLLVVVVFFVMYTRRKKSEYTIPKDYIGSAAQDDASRQAAADSYVLENCPGIESDTTSDDFLKFKQAVDDLGTGYMAVWPLTISTYTGTQPAGETVYKYKDAYEFPFWAQIASTADMRGAWFKYVTGKCPQLFTIEEQVAYSKWSYNPTLVTDARVTKWSQSAGTDGIFSGQTVLEVPSTSTEAWKSVAIDPVTNLPTTRATAMMMYGPASMIEYPAETPLYSFTSHTFTPAGATGQYGPSQVQVNTAYGATFASRVSVVGGIQKWTVPQTGLYIFDVKGGAGSLNWAKGRRLRGVVPLFKGEIINILVGQMGATTSTVGVLGYAGGGGGTFIVRDNGTVPLIVAAGGVGNYMGRPSYRLEWNGSTYVNVPYVVDPAETRVSEGAPVDDSSIYPFNYNTTWAITKYGPVVRSDYTLPTDPNALETLYRFPPPFGDILKRRGGGFQYTGSSTAGVSAGNSYVDGGNGGEYYSKGFGGFGGGSASPTDAAAGGYYGGYTNGSSGVKLPASSFLDGSVLYPDDTLTGDNDGFATFTLCAAGSYINTTTYACTACSTAGSYCPRNTDAVYTCPAGEYCSTAASRAPCTIGNYCPAGVSAPTQCTAGNYCPSTGLSTPTPCTAGNYCPAGVSTPTPCTNTGAYCPIGSASQSTCPAGSYCTSPSTIATCATAGYYCPAGTTSQIQYQCTAGNYCPAGVSAPTPCMTTGYYCPAGTTSQTQYQCTNKSYYCPAGATSQTQYLCSTCSTSQYQTASCTRSLDTVCASKKANDEWCSYSEQCITGSCAANMCRCPAGSYCPTPTTVATCATAGYYCPAGTTSQTQYQCTAGNYCQAGVSAPTPCPMGYFCPTPSTIYECTNSAIYCPTGSTAFLYCRICSPTEYQVSGCSRTANRVCATKKSSGSACSSSLTCMSSLCFLNKCM